MLNHTLHFSHLGHQAPTTRAAATAAPKPAPAQGTTPAALPSAALLKGHKTVAISHNGMLYTLQATKLGKLILTK
jgi:hemin uptake protein HemP